MYGTTDGIRKILGDIDDLVASYKNQLELTQAQAAADVDRIIELQERNEFLEQEVITSNEHRAFVRTLLMIACEALVENPPHPDQTHGIVAKNFRDALTEICELIQGAGHDEP